MTYAIIRDSDQVCVNIIEWDGKELWTPPPGHSVISGDLRPVRGAVRLSDGSYGAPPPASRADIETRLIKLQTELLARQALGLNISNHESTIADLKRM